MLNDEDKKRRDIIEQSIERYGGCDRTDVLWLCQRLRELDDECQRYLTDANRDIATIDKLRKCCNGFKWLMNNIHNYGDQQWLEFFKAAAEDAEQALVREVCDA